MVKKSCFVCVSNKSADFGKFISQLFRLIRYGENGKKDDKIIFVISRIKRKLPH